MTLADLEKAMEELAKNAVPAAYDARGRPVYQLWVVGTPEEIRAVQYEMDRLDEELL